MDDGLENVGITGNVHIIDGFVAFSLLYEQCMMRGPRGQTVGQASGLVNGLQVTTSQCLCDVLLKKEKRSSLRFVRAAFQACV